MSKKCPNCGAGEDYISNFYDLANLLGLSTDGMKQWYCNKCHSSFDLDHSETWYDLENLENYSISQIADIIFSDWRNISPEAMPYLEAMVNLNTIDDNFGNDDGKTIILYFLSNAKKWKGKTARIVKDYLKKINKIKIAC